MQIDNYDDKKKQQICTFEVQKTPCLIGFTTYHFREFTASNIHCDRHGYLDDLRFLEKRIMKFQRAMSLHLNTRIKIRQPIVFMIF